MGQWLWGPCPQPLGLPMAPWLECRLPTAHVVLSTSPALSCPASCLPAGLPSLASVSTSPCCVQAVPAPPACVLSQLCWRAGSLTRLLLTWLLGAAFSVLPPGGPLRASLFLSCHGVFVFVDFVPCLTVRSSRAGPWSVFIPSCSKRARGVSTQGCFHVWSG